jgi:hypothetical protein
VRHGRLNQRVGLKDLPFAKRFDYISFRHLSHYSVPSVFRLAPPSGDPGGRIVNVGKAQPRYKDERGQGFSL